MPHVYAMSIHGIPFGPRISLLNHALACVRAPVACVMCASKEMFCCFQIDLRPEIECFARRHMDMDRLNMGHEYRHAYGRVRIYVYMRHETGRITLQAVEHYSKWQ